jgi:hypothetical protein
MWKDYLRSLFNVEKAIMVNLIANNLWNTIALEISDCTILLMEISIIRDQANIV